MSTAFAMAKFLRFLHKDSVGSVVSGVGGVTSLLKSNAGTGENEELREASAPSREPGLADRATALSRRPS